MTEIGNSDLLNKRVAIIGAGPSGAIALTSFLRQGFKHVTVFEKRPVAGGTWSLDEDLGFKPDSTKLPIGKSRTEAQPPTVVPEEADSATFAQPFSKCSDPRELRYDESSMYPSVETNILAEFMAFTEKPFERQVAPCARKYGKQHDFRTHKVVRKYVLELFEGKEEYLQFNTTVEKALQLDGPGSQWHLTLRRHCYGSTTEEWWTEDFDYLYAASGRFSVPRIPHIPGLERVLKQLPRESVIHTKVYRDPEIFRNKNVLLVGASWSNADVAHAIADIANKPVHLSFNTILQHTVPAFKQPFIVAHTGIKRVTLNSNGKSLNVEFNSKEVISGIEKVVFGTGYHIAYPYLEEYLNLYGGIWHGERATKNLYWSTWWKHDSSLVISSIVTDGITWRAIEAQARATAYLWSGFPGSQPFTIEEAEQWENDRRKLNLRDFHLWWPQYAEFIAGITKVGTGGTRFPGQDIDTHSYNDLFIRSLTLKGEQWASESEKRCKNKLALQTYEQTSEQLEARKIVA